MSERALKKRLNKGFLALSEASGEPYHFQLHEGFSQEGIPDISIGYAGEDYWIETKWDKVPLNEGNLYRPHFEPVSYTHLTLPTIYSV